MAETAAELLAGITRRLHVAGVASPDVDARHLLRAALGWSQADLVVRARDPLNAPQVAAVSALADRRADREPLQLVLGTVGFRTIDVDVRAGVFIPRPETELLAGLAVARAPTSAVVVEPCTGTGAVACAIAMERPDVTVHAGDIDPAAVALARHNAERLSVDVTVTLAALRDTPGDALHGRVDVLVCNPPYLAACERAALPPEVANWDPPRALVSGPTGHECSDALITMATTMLRPGGWLLVELDERRVAEAAARASAAGLTAVEVHADLTGRPRFLAARRDRDVSPAT